MTKNLTGKQRLFVEYYLQTWNAVKAARLAGYKGSYETLGVMGHDNLKKPKIKEAIDKRLQELVMDTNEILNRLSQQARGSISEFVDDKGIIDWELVHDKGYLVKKLTHTKGKQSTIEIYDAQSALVHLGRHYGLFKERIEINIVRQVWETMEKLGLTLDDIKTDRLAHTLFATAGIEIANPKATGTDSSGQGDKKD